MADNQQDYYDALGVSRDADQSDIKKAYRRLAMKHHPDRNQGDPKSEQKFKEIKQAYSILSDEQKRAAYDQFGHAGVNGQQAGSGGNDFGDIFDSFFGDIFDRGGRSGRQQSRGADLQYNIELSLEEAVHGKNIDITIPKLVQCGKCKGSGSKKSSSPVSCPTCSGQGQVRMQQGFFSIQQTCPQCRGKGKIISDPCGSCHGQGRVKDNKTITVKIPAGVDIGDNVRVSGEGEAGEDNGISGDLYVRINIKRHAIFERDARDLHCTVPISFTTAALGGEVEVPTLDGKVMLKVLSETQTGKRYRLQGKGVITVRQATKGDLYCNIVVETPVNLDSKQKDILRTFEDSIKDGGKKHSPHTASWLDSVKNFFK